MNRLTSMLRYVSLRKPVFMARAARFYWDTFVRKTSRLRYVDFAIGYACNLKCQHCFATALHDSPVPGTLSLGEYGDLARQARDLGAIHLSLQGGEPTIAPNLFDIIASMNPWGVLFSLTTNGTRITHRLAGDLYRVGVDQLNVSVDSLEPCEHDAFRGRAGALASTLAGIEIARRCGLQVQVNCTVSHQNLHTPGFRRVVDYCGRNGFILNVVLAAPSGNWAGAEEFLLTSDDMIVVRDLICSKPWVRHDSDAIRLGHGCPAAREAIYVTPAGEVMSCPFIHVSLGNVRKESLGDILVRAQKTYPFFTAGVTQCLAAQDRGFMDEFMRPLAGRKLPAPHAEVWSGRTWEKP